MHKHYSILLTAIYLLTSNSWGMETIAITSQTKSPLEQLITEVNASDFEYHNIHKPSQLAEEEYLTFIAHWMIHKAHIQTPFWHHASEQLIDAGFRKFRKQYPQFIKVFGTSSTLWDSAQTLPLHCLIRRIVCRIRIVALERNLFTSIVTLLST